MSDPTTLRKFYYQGERRSGRSNTRSAKGGASLGGDALQQGIEVRTTKQSRGLLPVFAGAGRYKTIRQYRVASGNRKRVVYASEDSRENNYFLDSDQIARPRFLITSSSNQNKTLGNWVRVASNGTIIGDKITDPTLIELLQNFAMPPSSYYNEFADQNIKNKQYDFPNNVYIMPDRPEGLSGNHQIMIHNFLLFVGYVINPTANVSFPDGQIIQVPDYSVNINSYGLGKEYLTNTPFTELGKYDPIAYVKENGPAGMFPEISKSPSYTLDSIYDGVIEPFEIRQTLYGKSLFEVGEIGQAIKGDFSSNDIPEHHYSVLIRFFPAGGYFEDVGGSNPEHHVITAAVGTLGDASYVPPKAKTPIDEAAYVTETKPYHAPFVEKDSSLEGIKSPVSNAFVDEGIESQLLKMSPNISQNDLPAQHVDMSVGYTGRALDRFGSLVYRDMLR